MSFLETAWSKFWSNKPDSIEMTEREAKLIEAGYKCGAAAMFKFMVNLSDCGKTEEEIMAIYYSINEEIDAMSEKGRPFMKGTLQ